MEGYLLLMFVALYVVITFLFLKGEKWHSKDAALMVLMIPGLIVVSGIGYVFIALAFIFVKITKLFTAIGDTLLTFCESVVSREVIEEDDTDVRAT